MADILPFFCGEAETNQMLDITCGDEILTR